jgi:hypothetical protein
LYTFCVPRGICGLGFLCMLEALCVVLVYLEALCVFFFLIYNTLTYQKKKILDSEAKSYQPVNVVIMS